MQLSESNDSMREQHIRFEFEHWYDGVTKRRVIFWSVVWCIVLYGAGWYVFSAITRANHWYYPHAFTLPMWFFVVVAIWFCGGMYAAVALATMTVHVIYRSRLISSFNQNFNYVFENECEMNTSPDLTSRFTGITKDELVTLKDMLDRRINSVPWSRNL